MEDTYDQHDPVAQRDKSILFLNLMKDFVDGALEYRGLSDVDRETLRIVKKKFYAFEQLDKSFIAPRVAADSSMAAFGYEMLRALMHASFYAGSRGTLTDSAFRYVDGKTQSSRGSLGGLAAGKTNQRKQAEGWAEE